MTRSSKPISLPFRCRRSIAMAAVVGATMLFATDAHAQTNTTSGNTQGTGTNGAGSTLTGQNLFSTSTISSMPKLVQIVPVEFSDVALVDVVHAISVQTEIPILTDRRRAFDANISLSKLKVNQEYRKMTWSGLLDKVTFPLLMRELLQDEAGTPFVWVTTRTVAQMNERARQRDRLVEQKAK